MTVAATVAMGLVFAWSLPVGDVLFVALIFGARLAGRYGPAAAAAGRALLLPLLALFIAPPVPPGRHPGATLGWIVVACLVAGGFTALLPTLLPRPRPSLTAVAKAARAGNRRRLETAGRALHARLPADDEAAHRALYEVQHTGPSALDQLAAALAAPVIVPAAPAASSAGVPGEPPADTPANRPADVAAGSPGDLPSPSVYARYATQSATALALAFLAGQTLFGRHWPWTVLTVLTVSLGARTRGEVILKAVQRLAGAAAATVAATLLVTVVRGHTGVTVGLVLAFLAAGMYLREVSYLWWAAAITGVLTLLYSLLGETDAGPVLGARLLAIALGGLCAVAPAALLAPVRTRDLVAKRTAACLRLAHAGTAAGVWRFERAVAELRDAARPLLLSRRLRPTPEAAWTVALTGLVPRLRAHLVDPGADDVRREVGDIARAVRAARSPAPRPASTT